MSCEAGTDLNEVRAPRVLERHLEREVEKAVRRLVASPRRTAADAGQRLGDIRPSHAKRDRPDPTMWFDEEFHSNLGSFDDRPIVILYVVSRGKWRRSPLAE